jgi:hypothetical protein
VLVLVLVLVLAALSLASPRAARAAGSESAAVGTRTVVIVFDPHTEAVSQRLRQEIEAIGFEVELRPESGEAVSLESLAATDHAIAAIRVKPLEAGGVEMTVLDRATGKTVHRELARVSATDPAGEELVATRTVELFRASLMELDADHPARGDVRAPERVQAAVHHEAERQLRERTGVLSLAAGPALLLMPKWQPSAQFWLEAAWVSSLGVGVSASVQSPLSPARLTGDEGAVSLFATSYRVGVIWDSPHNLDFSGRFGAGWAVTTVSLRGDASSPYVGLQADLVAWSPWLSAAARVRVTSHVALYAELSCMVAVPRETVRFVGRDVGDFARPACSGAFGPELSWP